MLTPTVAPRNGPICNNAREQHGEVVREILAYWLRCGIFMTIYCCCFAACDTMLRCNGMVSA